MNKSIINKFLGQNVAVLMQDANGKEFLMFGEIVPISPSVGVYQLLFNSGIKVLFSYAAVKSIIIL